MLRIRLTRVGKKRQPSYRIVVSNVTSKRDGRIVEQIGFYNPLVDPIAYTLKEDRALYWLSVGAQPSDAVRRLLVKQGTVDRVARLHAGESFEALVAEYEGVDLEAVAAATVAVAPVSVAPVSVVTEEEE
ncbi:MAG: 30S ribosomal protein S16 [Chloroflexota bacterium]|jgi:small subunit ribosomal protein S16